jgi:hypothetical protein
MNDMRKLMEAVEQLTEGWDVEGIADVIYDEIRDVNSPVRKAYDESNEPFRGAIYTYGQLSGLFNPEAIDGSEIYHKIVDRLEAKVAGLQEDEDDDGDVPSRRVSDEELLAKVESKINDALKAIAMGLKAEKVGESKVLAVQLRRDLKELKAFIESGGDALGLRAKLHLAFVKAEKLADYSYEYDDVLWELNDADNLLYLHLSGRPVAIDEGIFDKPADKKSAIISFARSKAEDAMRYADLGKELYADHPSVEQFEAIRQELIDLQRWLRQRKQ